MTALAETAIAGVTVRELDIFIPKLPTSPYPGLRAFDKDEWPIFFGRERTTDELIEQLLQQQLIVVHGASGNGKSSLVRAGVQARLEQQHARFGLRWRTCVMRPGNAPLENLAAALAELTIDRADLPQIELRRALNHGQQSAETISRLLRLSGGDRVCIILDQFEELFRFAREGNRDQSSLLTDFLVGFQKSRPDGLFVLVTMRSEFLGECARFDGLAQTINRTQYLLPRMATTDLLRAVREPAALYGASVSERLAEQLVTEARDGQDELPLIQHGLSRLWQTAGSSDGAELIFDLPDYVSKGPLGRLLSDHADSIAERADENPDGQKIIEELFRALTDINADGVAIRRPQTFDELLAVTGTTDDRLRRILDAFCQPGVSFITPFKPAPIDRETTVDISHEALIRSWQRIADPQKGWLQREFRDGLIWRALVVQAESYAEDPQNLLSEATTEARSKWLQGRREGWARRYGGSWSRVQDLIEASKGEINRQKQKAKEDWQRAEDLRIERERARRRTVQTVASAIIAILMTGLAALTVWQRGIAIEAAQSEAEAKTAAEAARDAAEAARSRAEAAAQKEAQAKIAAEAAQTSSGVIAEALSSSSERDAAARLLNALDRTSDPYQIAVLGQSIAALPRRATDEELIRAAEVLARALAGTVDPSAASAIAQALTAVGQKLSTNGVHQALSPLLDAIPVTHDSGKLTGLATAVGALAPSLGPRQQGTAVRILFEALKRQTDPVVAGAIAKALSRLNWTPTDEQTRTAIEPLLKAIQYTTDPDLLAPLLATVVKAAGDDYGQMAKIASPLFLKLRETRDPLTVSLIAKALTQIDVGPTTQEAEAAIGPLLGAMRATRDPDQLESIAGALTKIAPEVRGKSSELAAALVQTLGESKNSSLTAEVAKTLQELSWKPTSDQARTIIGPLVNAIAGDRDAEQFNALSSVIKTVLASLRLTEVVQTEVVQALVPVLESGRAHEGAEIVKILMRVGWKPNRQQAQTAATAVVDRITGGLDQDTAEAQELGAALQSLAPWLSPNTAEVVLTRLRSMGKSLDPSALKALTSATDALAARSKAKE